MSTRTFAMLATKMLTFGNVFGHIQCSDFRDDVSEPIPRKRSNGLIYLEAMHNPKTKWIQGSNLAQAYNAGFAVEPMPDNVQ